MIGIDLSKQQELDVDLKAIQQITFARNLNRVENVNDNTVLFFIIEESEETIFRFFTRNCKSFVILYILLTTKSRSARGASRHPAFMNSFLTVSQSRLPCPPCGKMGLQSWTVVVAINKLANLDFDRSW